MRQAQKVMEKEDGVICLDYRVKKEVIQNTHSGKIGVDKGFTQALTGSSLLRHNKMTQF